METALIRDTAICTITFTTVAIALRFYSRLRTKENGLWFDDWLALAAWVFCVPAPALVVVAAKYQFRQHKLFDDSDFVKVRMLTFAGNIFYALSLVCSRTSALLFQIRIFARGTASSRKYRIWKFINYSLIVLSVAHALIYISIVSAYYSNFMTDRHKDGIVLSGCINIVIDVLILILPLPLLGTLQTSWKRRASLILLFILGYCVPAVSIARVIFAKKQSTVTFDTDSIRYLCIATALFTIEMAVAIISICLPSHVPLVREAVKRMREGASKARVRSSSSQVPLRMNAMREQNSQQILITEKDAASSKSHLSSTSSVDVKDSFAV